MKNSLLIAASLLSLVVQSPDLRAETTITVDGNIGEWAASDAQCFTDASGGSRDYVDVLKICATDASSTTGYFYFYVQFRRTSGETTWLASADVFLNVDYNNDGVIDARLDMIALSAPEANGVIDLPYLEMAVRYDLVDPANDGNFSFSVSTLWNNVAQDSGPNTGTVNYAIDPLTGSPRAVRLLSQGAVAQADNGVTLRWTTASETDNAGFHVYRQDGGEGEFHRLTIIPIPGLGNAPFGKTYQYDDEQGFEGDVYRIEDIAFDRRTVSHEPVVAQPAAGPDWLEELLPKNERPVPMAARIATFFQAAASAPPPPPPVGGPVSYRIDEKGLYFLSNATLAQIGLRASSAGISRLGKPVATMRTREGLYFVGIPKKDRYAEHAVYVAEALPALSLPAAISTKICANPSAVVAHTLILADDNAYNVATPTSDPFVYGSAFAGTPLSVPFDVPHFAGGSASLVVRLAGYADGLGGPDHIATVSLNGTVLGVQEWEGRAMTSLSFDIPEGILQSTGNVLSIAIPEDATLDMLSLDDVRITYSRILSADGSAMSFSAPPGQCVEISNPPARAMIFDITDTLRPVPVTALRTVDGKLRINVATADQITSGRARNYLVTSPSIADVPELEGALRRDGGLPPGVGADYLVIAHPRFRAAADRLAAHRADSGLRTLVVSIDDLYDRYTFGRPSPNAVMKLLTEASKTWSVPPSYVVLMGGASADSNDVLGGAQEDFIPTVYYRTALRGWEAASDSAFVKGLPGMTIGRLAVRDEAEANRVVDKLIAFSSESPVLNSLYIADKDAQSPDDPSGVFEDSVAKQLAHSGLWAAGVDTLFLNDAVDGRADMDMYIADGIDILSFQGHAFLSGWSSGPQLATLSYAQSLANEHLFLLLSWSCFDGAFVGPWDDSLAWEFVGGTAGGAVASLAGSSLSSPVAVVRYSEAVTEALSSGMAGTLGDAMLLAREDLNNSAGPDMDDTLATFNLLGDPATRNPWADNPL